MKRHKKKILQSMLTLAVFFLVLAGIRFYSGSIEKTPLQSQDGMTFVKAQVIEVTEGNTGNGGNEDSEMAGSQEVKVKLASGAHKGETVEASNLNGYLYGANCTVGTKVIVELSEYEGELTASVYGYDREIQLYMLIGLFFLLLCVVGRKQGACSAVALLFTFICLVGLYLPMLYQGWNAFAATIISVFLITVVSFLLISGYTKKTLCALLGTLAGVTISGAVALVFGKWAHISGYNTEEIESMLYVAQNSSLQVGDILYAGILLASLGAVMDVAMSVASSIQEISDQSPHLGRKELFLSGITVGRDVMGTMSNTLILAFAGSSLNIMILIYAYDYPYLQIINLYSIGIEILRGVSGTIGIICVVPLASLIASFIIHKNQPDKNRMVDE